jgi:hypothetical protein
MIIGKDFFKKIMNDTDGIPTLIVFIITTFLFVLLIFYRNRIQTDLKNHGTLVNAKIIRVNSGGRTSGGFECIFSYQGKVLEQPSPSTLQKGTFNFVNKTFPAMYSRKYQTLEVLITPTDFEKYNIPFPDSLNWVMPYVLNN